MQRDLTKTFSCSQINISKISRMFILCVIVKDRKNRSYSQRARITSKYQNSTLLKINRNINLRISNAINTEKKVKNKEISKAKVPPRKNLTIDHVEIEIIITKSS